MKALRRKDQAGHSSIDKSTVEAVSEGVVPQEAEVPTIKVSDQAVPEQDAAKELSALEDELDKATSGKIMNLISSDTYQREFADPLLAQQSAVLTTLRRICSFGSGKSRSRNGPHGSDVSDLTVLHSARTCTLSRARCRAR